MSLEEIKKEYETLIQQLSNPELISNNKENLEELLNRKKTLEKIINTEKEIKEIKIKIEEDKEILKNPKYTELSDLAEQELKELLKKQEILEKELENLLIHKDHPKQKQEKNLKSNSVIIEIRAGTGGDEAALFVKNLFKMYSKYAQTQGWKQKILDSHPTSFGGFKEIIFEFKNENVFSQMKYEGGVHRVQRIPETEKSGRIHTSTASVAVLLKPQKTQLKINPKDLRIDLYRASGPGGQLVNKRESAVRITHLPTGLVASSQTERNQLLNKENAMAILEAKLLEKQEQEQTEKLGNKRKAQIGQAKRAEKIRTYNFPQDRITDHRIKKSWHDIEEIMEGKLEPIIKSLQKELKT